MTAMCDGAIIQDFNPHHAIKADGTSDVLNDMNATFKYSLRSNPGNKNECDVRLSAEAARVAIWIGTQLKAAFASDPYSAASSALRLCCTVHCLSLTFLLL